MEEKFRRSNPWKGEKCGRPRCFPCMGDQGGDCWVEGVCYTLWCGQCGVTVASYKGETGRNGFSRGLDHLENLEARSEERSVLWLHSVHHHQSRDDVPYHMKVTSSHNTPMDRQVRERVDLTSFHGPVLMNRRNEMGGIRVERQRYRRWGGEV